MKKYWPLGLVLLLTSGCSKLDFALYWADTYVLSHVTDYFDLTSSQRTEFKKQFNTALHEVRKSEFPKIVLVLQATARLVEDNSVTQAQLEVQIKEVQILMRTALGRFEPIAQKLVADQAPLKFETFDEEFNDKYQSDLEKFTDLKQAKKSQRKQFDKWIDESIEDLTDSQKLSLESFLDRNPSPATLRLENRKKVFEAFKLARATEPTRTEFLKLYFSSWPMIESQEYKLSQSQYQEKLITWISELVLSLNEEQKKNLLANLNRRIVEFQKASLL